MNKAAITALLVSAMATTLLLTSARAQKFQIGDAVFDFADESLRPATSAEKAFVERYKAAVAGRDVDALRGLVHPKSLACNQTQAGQIFVGDVYKREFADTIPTNARIIFAPHVESLHRSFGGAISYLPVVPTATLGIDFDERVIDEKGNLLRIKGRTIVRPVVLEGGQILRVDHCLTEEGQRLVLQRLKSPSP